jgi:hypothetical protein
VCREENLKLSVPPSGKFWESLLVFGVIITAYSENLINAYIYSAGKLMNLKQVVCTVTTESQVIKGSFSYTFFNCILIILYISTCD